jgi:hypothetical protein
MRPQLFALGIAAIVSLPPAAAAQGRMPHQNATAIGAEGAVFMPKQDGMTTGPDFGGFFETYLTPRVGLRIGAEWSNPKREVEHVDSMRQVRVGADLVHNWEGGKIHPFVGAGLGAYFLQQKDNGVNFGDSATKLGGTLLGGLEVFTSKTFSVKGEARYHIVSKWNNYDPSGLALTIGAKAYF